MVLDHFTLSLCVGAVAGALTVIPMCSRGCGFGACVASFCTYLFAAIVIFYGDLPYLPWWADGMAVTLMMVLPGLFSSTTTGKERQSAAAVVLNALLLGFLISVAERFLG